jgi:hypothetical protein
MVNFVNLADIYGAVDRGRANDMAMENARMQNQQNQRIFAQQDREIADKEKVRSIYRESGGDLKTVRDRLYGEGYASEAMGIDKQLGEQRKQNSDISKTDLENAGKKIDLMGRGMKFVLDNPTKQNALQAFGALRQTGVITEDEFNNYTAKLPDDPAMIKNGAEVLFRSALDAKEQLSKFETRDTGGKVMTQAIDPITGQVKTVSTLGKTQTPDSIASNARMAAEGAANRAVTMRGQNLTDARARETNSPNAKAPAGYRFLPDGSLEAIKGGPADKKMLSTEKITEGMRSTGQYAARMKAAEDLLGLTTEQAPGIGEKIMGALGETSANITRSPDRQKALQAQRDWVRAKLRKESGAAIGVDEMNNEILTYFPQIGDSQSVIDQKKIARDQAVSGMIESSGGAYVAPAKPKKPARDVGSRDVRSEADKILGL